MGRVRRWTLLLALIVAAGCGASKRPYSHDPLLRSGRGVWGDPARGHIRDYRPSAEPDAPQPPSLLTQQASVSADVASALADFVIW